ncbi:MAG: hypothetical protein R3285_09680, partial [Kiloniellales bacterium]|nr:hypothetical protein [Kiloniellales bacterium]
KSGQTRSGGLSKSQVQVRAMGLAIAMSPESLCLCADRLPYNAGPPPHPTTHDSMIGGWSGREVGRQ